jgi:hypothetical protein
MRTIPAHKSRLNPDGSGTVEISVGLAKGEEMSPSPKENVGPVCVDKSAGGSHSLSPPARESDVKETVMLDAFSSAHAEDTKPAP